MNATVTSSLHVGKCGQDSNDDEHELTLSWTQDGEDHTTDYTDCGSDLRSGDETSAWLTSDGDVASLSGPWWAHVGGFAIVIAVGALIALTFGVILVGRIWKRLRA